MECFPENLEMAGKLSVKALAVPKRLWRCWVNSGNYLTFLNSFWRGVGITKRSILLASNPELIFAGGLYFMELEILRKLGYVADSSGKRLEFGREQIGNATGHPPTKTFCTNSRGTLQVVGFELHSRAAHNGGGIRLAALIRENLWKLKLQEI